MSTNSLTELPSKQDLADMAAGGFLDSVREGLVASILLLRITKEPPCCEDAQEAWGESPVEKNWGLLPAGATPRESL